MSDAASIAHDTPESARREAFIPARKPALIAAALADPNLPQTQKGPLENVCRLLAATLHYDYFEMLEGMREAYNAFDPDAGAQDHSSNQALDTAWARFDKALTESLIAANFEEIDADTEAQAAIRESESGVRVKTSRAGLRSMRYFVRNRRRTRLSRRRFWGLREEKIDADVFGDVILVVGYKAESELTPKERAAIQKRGTKLLRPSSIFVKQFKNIARGDLFSLHPSARITMKRSDQVMLAAPALFGGVPLIMNLLPALGVLFLVIGAYLGFQGGQVTHDATRKALAAFSGLVALGAFFMRQRLKYEAQRLRYQKKLSDNVYFRNVANNAGVFESLIGAAEEQEFKEAVIAYHRLLIEGPMTQAELDKSCESWIEQSLGAQVNFEVADAAEKLQRFGLIELHGGQFSAIAPDAALENLDKAWDALFAYRLTGQEPA